ncbi:MAG: N-acetylmuramoyl-L-alanine amidase [Defluviitaleaceae bacterium]|nr:N-acetylmuramoyl-L-alanine amidase [Defluviitaleaceae bacterium]
MRSNKAKNKNKTKTKGFLAIAAVTLVVIMASAIVYAIAIYGENPHVHNDSLIRFSVSTESGVIGFGELYRYLDNNHGVVLVLDTTEYNGIDAYRARLAFADEGVVVYIDMQTGEEIFREEGLALSADELMLVESRRDSADIAANTSNIAMFRTGSGPIGFGEMYRYLDSYHGTVLVLETATRNGIDAYRARLALGGEGVLIYIDIETGEEIFRQEGLVLNAGELRFAELRNNDAANIPIAHVPQVSNHGQFVVIIDPGHGGRAPGAVHGGVRESDLNLNITHRLLALIENNPNIRAYPTRTTDVGVGLWERAHFGNVHGDLFVSIHHNASYNRTAHGIETFFAHTHYDNNRSLTSRHFAYIMQGQLINNLGSFNRGVHTRRFAVLRYSRIPAVLLELGFMSNQNELARMRTDDFQQRAALAIYNGIVEALVVHGR